VVEAVVEAVVVVRSGLGLRSSVPSLPHPANPSATTAATAPTTGAAGLCRRRARTLDTHGMRASVAEVPRPLARERRDRHAVLRREVGLDRSQSFEDWQARNGKLVTRVSPTQGRITSSRAARDRGAPGGVRPVGHVVVGDPPTTTVVEAIPDRSGPDHAVRLLAIHPCQPEDLVAEIDRLHAELPPTAKSRCGARNGPPRRRHRGDRLLMVATRAGVRLIGRRRRENGPPVRWEPGGRPYRGGYPNSLRARRSVAFP
jgi:hypothetical protein